MQDAKSEKNVFIEGWVFQEEENLSDSSLNDVLDLDRAVCVYQMRME